MEHKFTLQDEPQTLRVAEALAAVLQVGDVICLRGPIGAGKSAFARAVIQRRQTLGGQTPEEVPSPSFTLIQTYNADGLQITHADLYRLGDTSELEELGLEEAISTGALIIEWPDLAGGDLPTRRLNIDLVPDDASSYARHLSLRSVGEGWDEAVHAMVSAPTGCRDPA